MNVVDGMLRYPTLPNLGHFTNQRKAPRACQTCKGGRALDEAGMCFHDPMFEPRRPRTRYLVLLSEIVPEGRQFVEI